MISLFAMFRNGYSAVSSCDDDEVPPKIVSESRKKDPSAPEVLLSESRKKDPSAPAAPLDDEQLNALRVYQEELSRKGIITEAMRARRDEKKGAGNQEGQRNTASPCYIGDMQCLSHI
jgi:hypothetical protein